METPNTYNPVPRLSLKERFRRTSSRHRKPIRILGATLAGLLLLFTVGVSMLYATMTSGLPDVTKLDQYDPARTSKIFASDGTLIATLFDENRTYAKYAEIAPLMFSALVAIEDRRFFEHDGVDYRGIARALIGNTSSGGVEQGASTLTMQLARRLFLSDEQTYARKVREAVLAQRIDSRLSKEKILELYLNEVYFGSGAYGIDAASSVYFGVDPKKLELWQAAMLAGLVQAPTAYSPLDDKPAALKRLDQVLSAMESDGKIAAPAAAQARKKAAAYSFVDRPLPSHDGMLKYPYFTTYVIRQLSEQFPDSYIRRGGLQVVTTLNIAVQEEAERALKQSLEGPGRAAGADAGAVVVLDNLNGDLVAMVGGPGWSAKKQFNAAWQAKRQPGSAFKVFIYAAALEAGYTPEQEFADTQSTFSPGQPEEWKPSNSDSLFMGPIPLRTGLQFSRNLVAAKLIAHVGPGRVIALAHRMGIDSDLPAVASLALGAGEVTPLQMARAFSALPSGGVLRPTHAIRKVTTAEGEVLKDFGKDDEVDRVLSKDTAMMMCEMLHRVVTGGTAQSANISNTYVAGKTGTTDNFKDAWFTGFTPHHTLAVWIGRDDNKPMGRMYGGDLPAVIFARVAKAALAKHDPAAPLPGVAFRDSSKATLCWDSTYLATPGCVKTYVDVFQAGVLPTRKCPIHRQITLPATVATISNVSASADPALNPAVGQPTPGGLVDPAPPTAPRQMTLSEANIPDNLNPRKDREVVTPAGAQIPYQETAPSLKALKFVIQAAPSVRIDPNASATPTMEIEDDPMEQSDPAVEPPLTDGSGVPQTADEDPAFQVGDPGSRPARNDVQRTAPIGGEPDYPVSGGANPQPVQAPPATDQVIYENKVDVPSSGEPTIPADATAE